MKNIQKKIISFLLVCMMTCLPVIQALAEKSYSAAGGLDSQLLFPGDSITDIASVIMLDGQEIAPEGDGGWTNHEDGRVYSATTEEDGSVTLSQAGYELTVEGGSSYLEGQDDSDRHYDFEDWEISEEQKDKACYQSGETVSLTAEIPDEGMEFAGWTSDTEGVSFADPTAMDTTFVMPERKTTVRATYQSAQQEDIPSDDGFGDVPADDGFGDVSSDDGFGDIPSDDGSGDIPADSGSGDFVIDDNTVDVSTDGGSDEIIIGGDTQNPTDNGFSDTSSDDGFGDIPADGGSGEIVIGEDEGQADDPLSFGADTTQYEVIVNNGSGAGYYEPGTWVTVTAFDRSGEGLQFSGWYVDSFNAELDQAGSDVTGFVMPSENVTVTATYAQQAPQSESAEQSVTNYTVEVNNGTGAGEFAPGTQVAVTAADLTAEGYEFTGWYAESENVTFDNIFAQTAFFTMPEENVIVTATYASLQDEGGEAEPPQNKTQIPQSETQEPQDESGADTQESDTVEVDPVQSGETESGPVTYEVYVENGLGSGQYAAGETVTVEAEEEEGLVFDGWETESSEVIMSDPSEAVSSFVMPASDVSLAATYTMSYNVTVENGVLSPGGTKGPEGFTAGTEVSVTADAAEDGLEFDSWEVTDTDTKELITDLLEDPTQETVQFSMPERNITIAAVYSAIVPEYLVTVGNGEIDGIERADSYTFQEGEVITVRADDSPYGKQFSHWEINGGAYDPGDDAYNSTIILTVDEDLDILAIYEGIEYSVTVKNGTSNYSKCVSGSVVKIVADPAPSGMKFDYWEVNTSNVGLKDLYSSTTTFVMPDADVKVTAHYKKIVYTVTVENGSSSSYSCYAGDTVTVSSYYPASGREFDKWVSLQGGVSFADSSRWKTTFVMPASDVVVKATYKYGPSTNDNLILDIVAGGEYYTTSKIKFSASGAGMGNDNPNPGDYRYRPAAYQIGNVTGSWNSSPYTTTMSIKAVGDYTLKVVFKKEIYNNGSWVADGTSDTKSVTFRVVKGAAGVNTGDDTNLFTPLLIAGISLGVFLICLIVFLIIFIRRRRR